MMLLNIYYKRHRHKYLLQTRPGDFVFEFIPSFDCVFCLSLTHVSILSSFLKQIYFSDSNLNFIWII